jgi:membrane protein required for colicin V production
VAWQIASLASFVLSYFVALRFGDQLAPHLGEQAPWNKFCAMLILYIATSFVVWLCFRVVAGAIDRVRLKEFDRQLGAMFGLAKGGLLCMAITLFTVSLLPGYRDPILSSKSGQYIARMIEKAQPVMPPEIHKLLDPYINSFEEQNRLRQNQPGQPAPAAPSAPPAYPGTITQPQAPSGTPARAASFPFGGQGGAAAPNR